MIIEKNKNIFHAKINLITNVKYIWLENSYNIKKHFDVQFCRNSIVYRKNDGTYYDLIADKVLDDDIKFYDKLGQEYILKDSLIPFNQLIEKKAMLLTKNKIRKLSVDILEFQDFSANDKLIKKLIK